MLLHPTEEQVTETSIYSLPTLVPITQLHSKQVYFGCLFTTIMDYRDYVYNSKTQMDEAQ